MIPIYSVRPNPYQPRKYFSDEAISDLADSIRQIGLLQPINVRRVGEGGYELIAGERRLRACKLAGLTEIKAIILDGAYDRDIAMIAMIENLNGKTCTFLRKRRVIRALSESMVSPRRNWPLGFPKPVHRGKQAAHIEVAPASQGTYCEKRAHRAACPGALRLHNEEAQLSWWSMFASAGFL